MFSIIVSLLFNRVLGMAEICIVM